MNVEQVIDRFEALAAIRVRIEAVVHRHQELIAANSLDREAWQELHREADAIAAAVTAIEDEDLSRLFAEIKDRFA